MKTFTTTLPCDPSRHYMVDTSERVREIKKLVDAGNYFTINRARRYGKTTTISALGNVLEDEYIVISLSFESIDSDVFKNGSTFARGMARIIVDAYEFEDVPIPEETVKELEALNNAGKKMATMDVLFRVIRRWLKRSDRRVVLIVDEVDKVGNNQVFLDFLGMLRDEYIRSNLKGRPAFQSVILASVTDVRNLKGKIRTKGKKGANSPWNIAVDFTVEMSLSEEGIKDMLDEYERDHVTGMDTATIARLIHDHTNGYPYLVSRICQIMDTQAEIAEGSSTAWTQVGFNDAVRMLLSENNALFQSITKNLSEYPELKASIRCILMEGVRIGWNGQQDAIAQMEMLGLIRKVGNEVRVANRIFETMLYNLFLSDEELKRNVFSRKGASESSMFVQDGKLNMRLVLERFIDTYLKVFGSLGERFKEKDGRELFLLYLKPIINGTGNYYIEAQTRNETRTDVVVDYHGQQYVVELKIWRGPRYNADGEQQISRYLDYFGLSCGYMLSFNFNKKKTVGMKKVQVGDKVLFEATL